MPTASPPRSSIYRTTERAVGGDLRTFLEAQRDGEASFEAIAQRLQDLNVLVSRETIRAWCQRLGIEAKAAS